MIPLLAPALTVARAVPVWAWALAACLAWGGFQRYRATTATKAAAVAEQRAAVEKATAEAEALARQAEQQWAANVRSAADAYTANLTRARAGADAARSELDRLRAVVSGTAAAPASGAASGAAAAGGSDGAAGLRVVVGQCAAALQALAGTADQCEARVKGLQDYVRGTQR